MLSNLDPGELKTAELKRKPLVESDFLAFERKCDGSGNGIDGAITEENSEVDDDDGDGDGDGAVSEKHVVSDAQMFLFVSLFTKKVTGM